MSFSSEDSSSSAALMENDSRSNDESDLRRRFCAAAAETKRLAIEVGEEQTRANAGAEQSERRAQDDKTYMWTPTRVVNVGRKAEKGVTREMCLDPSHAHHHSNRTPSLPAISHGCVLSATACHLNSHAHPADLLMFPCSSATIGCKPRWLPRDETARFSAATD